MASQLQPPTLLILIGPPGSGKTHFAHRFMAEHPNYLHINNDKVRKDYIPNATYSPAERPIVYGKMHELTREALANGQSVIFDGNLVTSDARQQLFAECQPLAKTIVFVYFKAPTKLAIERATTRTATDDGFYNVMPVDKAHAMHGKYEPLDPGLPHVTVDGQATYKEQMASLLSYKR